MRRALRVNRRSPLRLLHSGDLHLGRRFAGIADGERLAVARLEAVTTLAALARRHGAAHVVLAGDIFETPNPATRTWRHALETMAEADGLDWWLLPGNHDNLAEGAATWTAIRATGAPGVHVLDTDAPRALGPDAWLLPAPVPVRRPVTDPTDTLGDRPTPEGAIRVGLAHGPIQGFGSGDAPPGTIAPDRTRTAGLDYLALGDWHGTLRVSDRAWYAGAAERTGFRHDGPGQCLLVEIEAPGAVPTVTPLPVGRFDWRTVALDLLPGEDPATLLPMRLPAAGRRDVLLSVVLRGRTTLGDFARLGALKEELVGAFCHVVLETDDLVPQIETADLDAIAPGGALRAAGDALRAEAEDPALDARARAVAREALLRLHAVVAEAAP